MSAIGNDLVRELILGILAPKRVQIDLPVIDDDTNLTALGMIDSADLLEVIVLVEEQAGLVFQPEGLDLETGLTLRQLIGAFVNAASADGKQPQTEVSKR